MESLRSHPLVTGLIMAGFVVGVLLLLQVAGGLAEGIARPGLTDALYALAFAGAVIVHLHIGHQYLEKDNRHVLLVLEGELETELRDGRRFTLVPGVSYQVSDFGDAAHRSSTRTGAKLFIVD